MRKVIIIGCPGSGKTIFATQLARITKLPLIHLDAVFHKLIWDQDPLKKKVEWRQYMQKLVKGDKWIIDGNYKSTLDIRIAAADTIIFLDYPRWLAVLRVFKRYWQYRDKKRPDMPDNWREKMDPEFLDLVWTYRKEQRPRVLQMLIPHKHSKQIIILSRPKIATRFLYNLEHTIARNNIKNLLKLHAA